MSNLEKILNNKTSCKSIWFMRQAGRYLPEFRKIRSKNKNFIKLCLNSELSSKISLQPIKRFDLDSAIIFSDILIVPYALGQTVNFFKKKGPKLNRFNYEYFLNTNENEFFRKLKPVYKAIKLTRKKLDKKKSLISFVGAPFTLLIYMLDLKKSNSKLNTKKFKSLENLDKIMDKLILFLCLHIKKQSKAGANVVQIFDSWAGLIPDKYKKDYCFIPNKKIVDFCKKHKIPTICFPRGIKKKYKDFNKFVKPSCLNLDSSISPYWAKKNLKNVVLQGGLDPKILLRSNEAILKGAMKYIQTFKDIPYIFNLGHGLLPQTDPDKVNKLIKFYRSYNG